MRKTVRNEVAELKSSMVSITERVVVMEKSAQNQPTYSQAPALTHEVRKIN